MKPKHILFLLPEFPILGGMEKITAGVAGKLAERGHRVTIYAAKPTQSEVNIPLNDLITLHYTGNWKDRSEEAQKLIEYLHQEKVDIIINESLVSSPVTDVLEIVREQTHIHVIQVYHGMPRVTYHRPRAENEGVRYKRLIKSIFWPLYCIRNQKRYVRDIRRVLQCSDIMVVLSPEFIENIYEIAGSEFLNSLKDKSHGHQSHSKVVCIPNFVEYLPQTGGVQGDVQEDVWEDVKDDVEEDMYRGAAGFAKRENRIIYCGRIRENQKRVLRVLRIWERTAPLFPDWELDLIGDGPDMKRYKRYVRKRGIERVNFRGYISRPREMMYASKILLLTSDHEGMGLVVAEAQLSGCVPVIYNSFVTASHLIENGKDGLLIPPFEEDKFIRGLHRLMQSPEELDRMSRNAEENREKYDPAGIVDKWEEIICAVTSSSPREQTD